MAPSSFFKPKNLKPIAEGENDYHHIFTKFIIRNSVYFIRTGQFKELCKLFKYYIRGWHNNYENS